MINFTCTCGNQLSALDEQAGRTIRCPMCQRDAIIPGEIGIQSSTPAPAPPAYVAPGQPPARARFDDMQRYPHRPSGEPLRTDGMAITSMWLGAISFCVPVALSIVAIILGILGLSNISKGKAKGRGFAITGIITGAVSIIISPIVLYFGVIVGLLLPAVQKVRHASARMQSSNNMMQIGTAIHIYHDTHGRLPEAAIYSKNGRPLLSWRVAILPFIEQDGLFRRFRLDEPWDSPNNKALVPLMPPTYFHPEQKQLPPEGLTYYQAIVGKPGVRPQPIFISKKGSGVGLGRIPDGMANTVLIAESSTPVVWTKPDDIRYDPARPIPKLGVLPGGFNLGFADGSVRWFGARQLTAATLHAAITKDGAEVVRLP